MIKLLYVGITTLLLTVIGALSFIAPPSTIDNQPATEPTAVATSSTSNVPPPIGKLIMVGHWAHTPTASTTALIENTQAGGVIIMSAPENPSDIKDWVTEWNTVSDTPLLIAIDQEGGPVTRLKGNGFIQTGQRDIKTTEEAYTVGYERGQELAELGINMNFAPVLDIANDPSSFMYTRVFPSASNAATLAGAMSRGMQAAGVIAVAKHFPGHPDTITDSHIALPSVEISKAELGIFTKQFVDYVEIESPLALMTAHVLFPNIDTVPATLSHFFLTEYLRVTLGFSGVIITDDMSMDAIDTTWTTEEASLLSIQAGADMILFAAELEKARSAVTFLESSLQNGAIKAEEIEKHLLRLEALSNLNQ